MNYNYYLLNTLFQNRNRFYGAYTLRLYYNERLLKSTLFAILGFIAFIYLLRWGFHAEGKSLIPISDKKDSSHVITIPYWKYPPVEPAKSAANAAKKGTPNTKPIIVPDKGATSEALDTKKKGALNADTKAKNIDGSVIPGLGQITFVPPKPTKPPIYNKVTKMAEFPGLNQYLENEIGNPENINEYGKLLLSFVVELDGSLSALKIEQGLENQLNELTFNALEKISKPGMWKPAEVEGVKVRFRYIMPFNFVDENIKR